MVTVNTAGLIDVPAELLIGLVDTSNPFSLKEGQANIGRGRLACCVQSQSTLVAYCQDRTATGMALAAVGSKSPSLTIQRYR